tara:strand:+ start:62 stop:190 length:129 start_codon:yes stop_codon:yes gene_type:complete
MYLVILSLVVVVAELIIGDGAIAVVFVFIIAIKFNLDFKSLS